MLIGLLCLFSLLYYFSYCKFKFIPLRIKTMNIFLQSLMSFTWSYNLQQTIPDSSILVWLLILKKVFVYSYVLAVKPYKLYKKAIVNLTMDLKIRTPMTLGQPPQGTKGAKPWVWPLTPTKCHYIGGIAIYISKSKHYVNI